MYVDRDEDMMYDTGSGMWQDKTLMKHVDKYSMKHVDKYSMKRFAK